MGEPEDRLQRRLQGEQESEADAARGASEDAIRKSEIQSRCYYERACLEELKERLEPSFSRLLRKSPVTLFLFPHISPFRIEQKSKRDKPSLICDYGLQEGRPNSNSAEKQRTVIAIDDDNNYEIKELGMAVISLGTMAEPKREWRTDQGYNSERVDSHPYKGTKNPYTCDLEEAVSYMEERFVDARVKHNKLAPRRAFGAGLGALALATLFGLHQCSDADAHDIERLGADADRIELNQGYSDHEP